MAQDHLPAKKLTLEEVQEQFETWRRRRRKKEPIPKTLWYAAASLGGDYPLLQISTTLRVNYSDLRRHVLARKSLSTSAPQWSFVELERTQSNRSVHYSIELEDRFGSRMKVCCSDGGELNAVELIKVFWST